LFATLLYPNVDFKRDKWAEKVRKGGGIWIEARKREFMFGDILKRLIDYYGASLGAAATNIFHPIRLSFFPILCDWKVYITA